MCKLCRCAFVRKIFRHTSTILQPRQTAQPKDPSVSRARTVENYSTHVCTILNSKELFQQRVWYWLFIVLLDMLTIRLLSLLDDREARRNTCSQHEDISYKISTLTCASPSRPSVLVVGPVRCAVSVQIQASTTCCKTLIGTRKSNSAPGQVTFIFTSLCGHNGGMPVWSVALHRAGTSAAVTPV